MFGIANQMLAAIALAVVTTVIVNGGTARYAWVTMLPMWFVAVTTLTAGVLSVQTNFWPMAIGPDPARHFTGYLNSGLTVMMMVAVVVILVNAAWRCVAGPVGAGASARGRRRLVVAEKLVEVSRLHHRHGKFALRLFPVSR